VEWCGCREAKVYGTSYVSTPTFYVVYLPLTYTLITFCVVCVA
jgi:hypothetical protein